MYGPPMKRCNRCGLTKELTDFNREKMAPDGHRYSCRDSDCARRRELARKDSRPCSVEGCTKARRGYTLHCSMHAARLRRTGETGPAALLRRPNGEPHPTTSGYLAIGSQYAHRVVMAEHLGRELFAHETVHHRNGDRWDNNPANLALWSSWQPSGQRVVDKIEWAKELLRLYEPSALSSQRRSPSRSRLAQST